MTSGQKKSFMNKLTFLLGDRISLFESEQMKEQLDYMYPGEILLNMSQMELLDKLLAYREEG